MGRVSHGMTEQGGDEAARPVGREPDGGERIHGFAGNADGERMERDAFLLGGGPALEGVDYEGEWLKARAEAQALNQLFAALGASVHSQAGWGDDGGGVVFMTGTLTGARLLRMVLAGEVSRMQDPGPVPRPGRGRGWGGRPAGTSG